MEQTKNILKKRFDNFKTDFTGTILIMSGHGSMDSNQRGFFVQKLTKETSNFFIRRLSKFGNKEATLIKIKISWLQSMHATREVW